MANDSAVNEDWLSRGVHRLNQVAIVKLSKDLYELRSFYVSGWSMIVCRDSVYNMKVIKNVLLDYVTRKVELARVLGPVRPRHPICNHKLSYSYGKLCETPSSPIRLVIKNKAGKYIVIFCDEDDLNSYFF